MATRISRKNLVSGTHRKHTSPTFEEDGKASLRNNLRATAKCLKQHLKISRAESENTDNTPKNAMNKTFVGETKTETATFSLKRTSRAGPWYLVGQIWQADEAACII